MGNTTKDNDVEVAVMVVVEINAVATTIRKEDKRTNKIGVDEDAVMEEVIVLIVQMLNVTIVENMGITQGFVMPRRQWKKMKI